MPYVEFPPRRDLADIVKCIWNYEASADETSERLERIVPDGNPELVVHYGEPFLETTPEHGKRRQPRVFLMGQITSPLMLDASRGTAGVLGVRFHPSGAGTLIGATMDELTGRHVSMSDIVPRAADILLDQVAHATNAPARAEIIQRFVADIAANNRRFQDAAVDRWIKRLANTRGRLAVIQLAGEASLSTRQLQRRFLAHVGITPRDYANIVRFRSVFDFLTAGGRPDWATLATDAGYFDQSHLSRDFRRFLGCSPATFLSQLRGLSAVLVGVEEETTCRIVTRRT